MCSTSPRPCKSVFDEWAVKGSGYAPSVTLLSAHHLGKSKCITSWKVMQRKNTCAPDRIIPAALDGGATVPA